MPPLRQVRIKVCYDLGVQRLVSNVPARLLSLRIDASRLQDQSEHGLVGARASRRQWSRYSWLEN